MDWVHDMFGEDIVSTVSTSCPEIDILRMLPLAIPETSMMI